MIDDKSYTGTTKPRVRRGRFFGGFFTERGVFILHIQVDITVCCIALCGQSS